MFNKTIFLPLSHLIIYDIFFKTRRRSTCPNDWHPLFLRKRVALARFCWSSSNWESLRGHCLRHGSSELPQGADIIHPFGWWWCLYSIKYRPPICILTRNWYTKKIFFSGTCWNFRMQLSSLLLLILVLCDNHANASRCSAH